MSVYVIILVPVATPVTTPALFTVATAGVPDTHGFTMAGVPDPVRVVVPPVQTANVPVIVGNAFTVTVTVLLHPRLFVYVMTLVPAETPVTTPVLLTVATAGVADTQGLTAAGVPEPVNVVVDPIQTASIPVMVVAAVSVRVAV